MTDALAGTSAQPAARYTRSSPCRRAGRKVVGWRLETPEETEARKNEIAKQRAEAANRYLFEGHDEHPEATEAAELHDGLF